MSGAGDVRPVEGGDRLSVLLLTDVEGSTEHWHRDPQQMGAAMDLVDMAVERSVAPGAGDIVRARGEGDSHFVVFTGAMAAVRAAATLQRLLRETAWPAGLVLRVRVALHAGDVKQRGNDYEGIAINRTARLRSTAHGGQVVVSRAVVELTGADMTDGLRFESLGRHLVRDLPGWTEIFQLCGPSMDRDFPSLVTLDTGCLRLRRSCISMRLDLPTPRGRGVPERSGMLLATSSMCSRPHFRPPAVNTSSSSATVALHCSPTPTRASPSREPHGPLQVGTKYPCVAPYTSAASSSYTRSPSGHCYSLQMRWSGERHRIASRSAAPQARYSVQTRTSSSSTELRDMRHRECAIRSDRAAVMARRGSTARSHPLVGWLLPPRHPY
jgi:class 3 adenylate cyclase